MMDPITHAVIGIAITKITGNAVALTNPAALGIVLGSVIPDADILLQRWGDYVYLKNHRGASHSLLGLAASAAVISVVLGAVYHSQNFLSLFLWTLAGCFSHTFFDLFNSYGARLLWPLCGRMFSFSLLIILDPIFIGSLLGYVFSGGYVQYIFLTVFILYLASRVFMRLMTLQQLKKEFSSTSIRISILPSMTGIFRWHFILENEKCNVIGEKSFLKSNIREVRRLYKIQGGTLEKVLLSPVGRFFGEFTPLFHILCENIDGTTRYIFIDMRYFIKNNFLHHAILEIDENESIVRQSFNPYTINRSVDI